MEKPFKTNLNDDGLVKREVLALNECYVVIEEAERPSQQSLEVEDVAEECQRVGQAPENTDNTNKLLHGA